MLNKIAIKLVKWLMTRDLTLDQRNSLVINILDNLGALPIYDIIDVSNTGQILIDGRELDIEKARILREGAKIVIDNPAFKITNERVLYQAVTMGVHNVENPSQMLFARAAIWYGQRMNEILRTLAGTDE